MRFSSNTLTFTNWTTQLNATNVTIRSNGIFTLPSAFTTNGMSNRVYISSCTNLTIETNGSIIADGKGYSAEQGPGAGSQASSFGSGAGHGGRGADMYTPGGAIYGSTNAPLGPGSGGGYGSGGSGGGSVRIEAAKVTVNGTITANSGSVKTYRGAGGSGGAIFIICDTFSGSTNGVLRADGGGAGGVAGGGV